MEVATRHTGGAHIQTLHYRTSSTTSLLVVVHPGFELLVKIRQSARIFIKEMSKYYEIFVYTKGSVSRNLPPLTTRAYETPYPIFNVVYVSQQFFFDASSKRYAEAAMKFIDPAQTARYHFVVVTLIRPCRLSTLAVNHFPRTHARRIFSREDEEAMGGVASSKNLSLVLSPFLPLDSMVSKEQSVAVLSAKDGCAGGARSYKPFASS